MRLTGWPGENPYTYIFRVHIMQILLALIPLLAFICIIIYLKDRYTSDPTRRVLILSAIWFGCYLMFFLEVLSIFRWVTVLGLVIAWMAPIVVFSFWLWHRKTSGERIVLPTFQFPNSWWNRLILLIICGVLIITVLVAWIT